MTSVALADGLPGRGKIGTPYQPVAGERISWTGLYLGGGVGTYTGLVDGVPVDLDNKEKIITSDLGSWGFLGDVRASYLYQFPNGQLVLGGFIGYSFGQANADFAIDGNAFEASVTPTWNAGAIIGIALDRSLLYTGYKYSLADVEVTGGLLNDDQLNGHSALLGIKMQAFGPIVAGLEYGYTMYDEVRIEGRRVDVEAHSVMLRGEIKLY